MAVAVFFNLLIADFVQVVLLPVCTDAFRILAAKKLLRKAADASFVIAESFEILPSGIADKDISHIIYDIANHGSSLSQH